MDGLGGAVLHAHVLDEEALGAGVNLAALQVVVAGFNHIVGVDFADGCWLELIPEDFALTSLARLVAHSVDALHAYIVPLINIIAIDVDLLAGNVNVVIVGEVVRNHGHVLLNEFIVVGSELIHTLLAIAVNKHLVTEQCGKDVVAVNVLGRDGHLYIVSIVILGKFGDSGSGRSGDLGLNLGESDIDMHTFMDYVEGSGDVIKAYESLMEDRKKYYYD